MDNKIIELFRSSEIQDDITIVKDFEIDEIDDINCIKDLIVEIHKISGELIFFESLNRGDVVNISLSSYKLFEQGYYNTFNDFLINNLIEIPDKFYIREFDFQYKVTTEIPIKIKKYFLTVQLIKSIEQLSNHSKNEAGLETLYIVRKKSNLLVLPIDYQVEDIEDNEISQDVVLDISQTFTGNNNEKKILYINELILFLDNADANIKFRFLIKNLNLFYSKCLNSFEYYLRNFTYNKFKIELDSAILNYTQKIRTVINEAQNKLIAIPAAFVLACATIDFSNTLAIKNLVALCSLFIFSLLIEIFIRNQLSSLDMIETDIGGYKNTFNSRINLNSEVTLGFNNIDAELKTQRYRIQIIRFITWAIPISLTILCLVLFIINYKPVAGSGSQLICWYNIF